MSEYNIPEDWKEKIQSIARAYASRTQYGITVNNPEAYRSFSDGMQAAIKEFSLSGGRWWVKASERLPKGNSFIEMVEVVARNVNTGKVKNLIVDNAKLYYWEEDEELGMHSQWEVENINEWEWLSESSSSVSIDERKVYEAGEVAEMFLSDDKVEEIFKDSARAFCLYMERNGYKLIKSTTIQDNEAPRI